MPNALILEYQKSVVRHAPSRLHKNWRAAGIDGTGFEETTINFANALRQLMNHDPANEPPIDLSLNHYMEEKALAVARDKADTETAGQRAKVEGLVKSRIALMELRASFQR